MSGKEDQNTEWKSGWHDDYLKWVAGFANAHGGTIYIGIDDDGTITGLSNPEELLVTLPDKIRNLMGVMTEVNLLEEAGLSYLQIKVPPYSVPISLRGRFYYRSGATKQELTGTALTDFLLKRVGKSWDDVVEPTATLADIDEQSVQIFRAAAARAGRVPEDVLALDTQSLLEKLRLTDSSGALKRAAIILFGRQPALYRNMAVKMGRFITDSELRFQEVEEGNLIQLLTEVPAQLNRKFLIKPIDFEGFQRIERGEYPVAALREALLNALIHRDYSGTTIQLRVYDNMLTIWNEGYLPEGITIAALQRLHPSRPRNPLLAEVCFKGGYIDAWGRGTLKILESCAAAGLPVPEMKEEDGGMMLKFFKPVSALDKGVRIKLNERMNAAMLYVEKEGKISRIAYEKLTGISSSVAREELAKLVKKGLLQRVGNAGPAVHYVLPADH